MEEIAAAVRDGAKLRGLICEKPLARNLAEARRVVELAKEIGAPTAYFENQIHMKMLQQARAQLAGSAAAMGPLTLVRAAEEHGGPHSGWFWDPTRQGGGVLSDMGCHSIAVGRYLLTPAGRPTRYLEPQRVSAHVEPAQVGSTPLARRAARSTRCRLRPNAGRGLRDRARDVPRIPTPDRRRSRSSRSRGCTTSRVCACSSTASGPGYALEANSLRSPLEVFIGDAAAASVADAELALEKATASRGLLAIQPNEPDLYGYTDENVDALAAFRDGRSALLDFDDGLDVVRLTMAAYMSAEQRTRHRPHRRRDPRRARDVRAARSSRVAAPRSCAVS